MYVAAFAAKIHGELQAMLVEFAYCLFKHNVTPTSHLSYWKVYPRLGGSLEVQVECIDSRAIYPLTVRAIFALHCFLVVTTPTRSVDGVQKFRKICTY